MSTFHEKLNACNFSRKLTFLDSERLVELEQRLLPVGLRVHGRSGEADLLVQALVVEKSVEARGHAGQLPVTHDLDGELGLELLDIVHRAA